MRNQDYLSNYDGLVWHVMGAKNTTELCYNFNTQINSNQIIQNIVEYQVQNDQYYEIFTLFILYCQLSLFQNISLVACWELPIVAIYTHDPFNESTQWKVNLHIHG